MKSWAGKEAFSEEGCHPEKIWLNVPTHSGENLRFEGLRFPKPGVQPLILFPGFFQNGYVWHLAKNTSLAGFLWKNGFDVWIIHPRGTAGSGGRKLTTTLDDFAADDIPAVINHVSAITSQKPIFVGHSQGGIVAMLSLMGATKSIGVPLALSDVVAAERQHALKGLVVLGSFPDMLFSKPSPLKDFANKGVFLRLGNRKLVLVPPQTLLRLFNRFRFIKMPLGLSMRLALLQRSLPRFLLFPLVVVLNAIAVAKPWQLLYHRPNISRANRKQLFYKTMDGTFSGILRQYHSAITKGAMYSADGSINYSTHYHRLKLPVSVVAMEYDAIADPVLMKRQLFDAIGSTEKFFTVWEGVGHEDHFANSTYFPRVLQAIEQLGQ